MIDSAFRAERPELLGRLIVFLQYVLKRDQIDRARARIRRMNLALFSHIIQLTESRRNGFRSVLIAKLTRRVVPDKVLRQLAQSPLRCTNQYA